MQDYKKLEPDFALSTWLVNFSQFWLEMFNLTRELQVWQKVDRQGNTYWKVYNPLTHETMRFWSEEEVLIWIDEFYCR